MEKGRVQKALSYINEALRLGNITEDDAYRLRNARFESKHEFERIYNVCTQLNSASFSRAYIDMVAM